jgi:hypothetical protein
MQTSFGLAYNYFLRWNLFRLQGCVALQQGTVAVTMIHPSLVTPRLQKLHAGSSCGTCLLALPCALVYSRKQVMWYAISPHRRIDS